METYRGIRPIDSAQPLHDIDHRWASQYRTPADGVRKAQRHQVRLGRKTSDKLIDLLLVAQQLMGVGLGPPRSGFVGQLKEYVRPVRISRCDYLPESLLVVQIASANIVVIDQDI